MPLSTGWHNADGDRYVSRSTWAARLVRELRERVTV